MTEKELLEAVATLTLSDLEYIRARADQAPAQDGKSYAKPAPVESAQESRHQRRKRRHVPHVWPEVGTELTAEYFGTTYRAVIVKARKRLKSGKQIRILTGPAKGKISDSMSEAMVRATAAQRKRDGLRRKGAANGWDFWQWDGKAGAS
jgi:hypothetical protein